MSGQLICMTLLRHSFLEISKDILKYQLHVQCFFLCSVYHDHKEVQSNPSLHNSLCISQDLTTSAHELKLAHTQCHIYPKYIDKSRRQCESQLRLLLKKSDLGRHCLPAENQKPQQTMDWSKFKHGTTLSRNGWTTKMPYNMLNTVNVLKMEWFDCDIGVMPQKDAKSGKQYRPRSDCSLGAVWSGSGLLAQPHLSQYLPFLQQL